METNKIYNKDCFELMRDMQNCGVNVDCILTSPPYNTGRNSGKMEHHEKRYDVYIESKNNQEYINWSCDLFNNFDKILTKNGKILYNLSYGTENAECMSLTISEIIKNTPFTLADIIVWHKNSALPNNVSPNKLTRICEFVYVFCRKTEYNTFKANKRVISIMEHTKQNCYENIYNYIQAKNNDENCPYNKATYSTELCFKLMNIYCGDNELIFDPFMGSGTTALACIKKGMRFIGSELSSKQVEWANNRISQQINQISMF